ncbi:MAG: DEAD/DEAH box helicase [Desulfosporosinus sp.]
MNLKTELMPHQFPAVEKSIRSTIFALFMSMGTGKTRTTFELVYRRLSKIDKVVYFCPVSLKETVRREILKHTDCEDSDIYVFGDKTSERNIPRALWYIIGIESMSSSTRMVLATNKLIAAKTFVILDESSYIKGHDSKRTTRITAMSARSRYRLILTGTPLSQGVVDLYAQMRFLSPKILGYNSFYSFAANHLEYSEKFPGRIVRSHNTKYLAAKTKPYVYQITKEECLDLPKKLYETRYFHMTDEQAHEYHLAKEQFLEELERDDFNSTSIFRMFTALQEIVCGFWNYRTRKGFKLFEFRHHRIETFMDVVADIPNDKKIIVWAKFQYDIQGIVRELTDKYGADSVAQFHGEIKERDRPRQVALFREQARFFVSTPSCGGHGLTLNESHFVIFYNNGFKYSERLQAEDRDHRIGQEHDVTYIDIHCSCSIDDRISKALATKEDAATSFREEVEKTQGDKNRLRELIKNL